jgi:hypothetical protein
MPVHVTRAQIASLRQVADAWAHKAGEEMDPEDAQVYREDAKDLLSVADALARSELREARALVDQMDTLVRDLIPSSLYTAVGLRALRRIAGGKS